VIKGLCGIDEAGRGPWAGPMTIAGVKLHKDIAELNDSKKLSEKKRELLYDIIVKNSSYHIVSIDNNTIDKLGLSACLKNAIEEIINNIDASTYLMDGNTSFGIDNLEHKIKADATISEVSAASILAKVTRDRYMIEISKDYPKYDFHKHKGYGTKAHKEAILEYGFCPIHRRSYNIKGINC
jgi:ribonuclease HII